MIGLSTPQFMLDIETYGRRPGCVVKQIGWASFMAQEPSLIDSGIIVIDAEDSFRRGLVLEPGTVEWWLGQSDEARRSLLKPGVGIVRALDLVKQAYAKVGTKNVWCRGTDFDLPILGYLFDLVSEEPPWPYDAGRDVRTLLELFPDDGEPEIVPEVPHDGRCDAVAQALRTARALRKAIACGCLL